MSLQVRGNRGAILRAFQQLESVELLVRSSPPHR